MLKRTRKIVSSLISVSAIATIIVFASYVGTIVYLTKDASDYFIER